MYWMTIYCHYLNVCMIEETSLWVFEFFLFAQVAENAILTLLESISWPLVFILVLF